MVQLIIDFEMSCQPFSVQQKSEQETSLEKHIDQKWNEEQLFRDGWSMIWINQKGDKKIKRYWNQECPRKRQEKNNGVGFKKIYVKQSIIKIIKRKTEYGES